jgi:uncharacterized protein (TIGR03435 family)
LLLLAATVLLLGGVPQTTQPVRIEIRGFVLEPCAAGVTGGELKKRIEGVMSSPFTRKLNFGKKLLLAAAAVVAIAVPIAVGLINAPRGSAQSQTPASLPSFEVASVKESTAFGGQAAEERDKGWGDITGRVNLRYITLRYVLMHAYNLQSHQLLGPFWLDTLHFDIFATVPAGMPKEKIPLMFQSMLDDRFGLRFHKEMRPSSVYALEIAEGGSKLEKALPEDSQGSEWELGPPKLTGSGEHKAITGTTAGLYGKMKITISPAWHLEFAGVTMDGLGRYLSNGIMDRPVVNLTGLSGSYRMILDIAFEDTPSQRDRVRADDGDAQQPVPRASEPPGASIRESLRKAGLRLVSRKIPIETLVVDHIERTPTEN